MKELNEKEIKIEKLAAKAHEIWSHWMHYMFSRTVKRANGDVVIPAFSVERWKRQMRLSYENLTEKEKQSDRKIAERYLLR